MFPPVSAPAPISPPGYRPPQLLRDVQLLNVLELTGSTLRASRHLALSQPSVSRRYKRLAHDFGLRRDRRLGWGHRFGSNGSIRHLRLAARSHRMAAGQVALGSDPLHWPLFRGLDGLLSPPPCFLPGAVWCHLVREGVVDAALVPAFELESGGRPGPGVRALELGGLPLALLAPLGGEEREVLAPDPERAPGLVRLLENRGFPLKRAPRLAQDWREWLTLLEPGGPRLLVPGPLAPALLPTLPVALEPVPQDGNLEETLWLLLAEELVDSGVEARIRQALPHGPVGRPAG